MTDWQPIETAPKDGADILIWSKEAGWHAIVKWWRKKSGPRWVCSFTHKRHLCAPSHWMPLPPPPSMGADTRQHYRGGEKRPDDPDFGCPTNPSSGNDMSPHADIAALMRCNENVQRWLNERTQERNALRTQLDEAVAAIEKLRRYQAALEEIATCGGDYEGMALANIARVALEAEVKQ